VTRYRLRVGLRTWPWREKREHAVRDALDEGLASHDEHVTSRIYLDELCEIEEEGRS
jgi:hypothetical protein